MFPKVPSLGSMEHLNSRTSLRIDLEVDSEEEETCRNNLISYEAHTMTPVGHRCDEMTNKQVRWGKVLQIQEALSQKDMPFSIMTLDEGEPVDKKF